MPQLTAVDAVMCMNDLRRVFAEKRGEPDGRQAGGLEHSLISESQIKPPVTHQPVWSWLLAGAHLQADEAGIESRLAPGLHVYPPFGEMAEDAGGVEDPRRRSRCPLIAGSLGGLQRSTVVLRVALGRGVGDHEAEFRRGCALHDPVHLDQRNFVKVAPVITALRESLPTVTGPSRTRGDGILSDFGLASEKDPRALGPK